MVKPATKSAGTKKPTVITAVTAQVGNQGFSTTPIMHNIQIDSEFQALIPLLSAEERAQLEANLLADGCRDPLVVWPCATYEVLLCTGETQTLRYEDRRYELAAVDGEAGCDAWQLDADVHDDFAEHLFGDMLYVDDWPCILIDGHNRYEICTRLGLPFEVVVQEFSNRDHATEWIINNQFGRRNLSDYQRGVLALRMKPIMQKRAEEKRSETQGRPEKLSQISDAVIQQPAEKIRADEAVSNLANISRDTIRKIEHIEADAAPEVKALAAAGGVSINAAAAIATLPQAEQTELVARGTKEILQAAKEIRAARSEERRNERIEKIVAISTGNAPVGSIAERYPVIYLDPPWRYEHAESESRAIENQYPTMSLEEIKAMDMTKVAFDDCVMFMWTTSPKLAEAFEVLDAWGFSYRTCAVWDKQKIGMGYYFRQQHELLLIAVKGQPPTPAPADRPSSVFSYPRGNHSAKPHEVYEIIEAMYPTLPKIEMFCRTPREGWGVWGNQSKAA